MALDVSTSHKSPELGPEHFGKWVAVRGGEVVAFAENYDKLVQDVRVRSEDDVFFVAESMF
jgi:hypothetical protein